MLSGIGNRSALSDLGIQTVIDLPDVGEHLQDHPLWPNYFSVNSNGTFDTVLRNATVSAQDLALWNETHTGLFTDTISNQLGFLRIPDNSSIFDVSPDPSAGKLDENKIGRSTPNLLQAISQGTMSFFSL